jgi:acyl-CoA thioester hydrolase
MTQTYFAAKPIEITGQRVLPEWIDYNGHMNVAYYVLAFDKALDNVFDMLDLGIDYVQRTGDSAFILQNHVAYLNELKLDDPIRVSFQLLDWDAKKAHYFMHMYHATEGFLAASAEQVMLHVSLGTRRSSPFAPETQARLMALQGAHRNLPRPHGAGAGIGIHRKTSA